jgi:hypothetical protein
MCVSYLNNNKQVPLKTVLKRTHALGCAPYFAKAISYAHKMLMNLTVVVNFKNIVLMPYTAKIK